MSSIKATLNNGNNPGDLVFLPKVRVSVVLVLDCNRYLASEEAALKVRDSLSRLLNNKLVKCPGQGEACIDASDRDDVMSD